MSIPDNFDGPTAADLAEIDREMPLIKAWMDLDWIEIYFDTTTRDLTDLDVIRHRRAARRVAAEARKFYDRPAKGPQRLASAA